MPPRIAPANLPQHPLRPALQAIDSCGQESSHSSSWPEHEFRAGGSESIVCFESSTWLSLLNASALQGADLIRPCRKDSPELLADQTGNHPALIPTMITRDG